MKTLDRYIIRQFVINFIILYVVLMSLFIVVDLIVDLDEFLKGGYNWALHHTVARQADEMGLPVSELTALVESDTHPELIAEKMHLSVEDAVQLIEDSQPGFLMRTMGVFWLVGDYYGPLLVLIYAFFSGLIVVAAMGFTLSGLGRSREMTAMVSSGISLYRVAMPIILAGIVLNTLALPVQEFVVPELAGKLGRKKSNIKNISVDRYAFQYIPDEKGALLTAAKFDPANEQLEGLRIILRENGMQVGFITASTAQWDPDRDGWELFDAYQIVPSTKHLDDIGLDVPGNESIPIDFYATDLSPTLIKTRQDADYVRLLPVSQLQQMQNSEAVPRIVESGRGTHEVGAYLPADRQRADPRDGFAVLPAALAGKHDAQIGHGRGHVYRLLGRGDDITRNGLRLAEPRRRRMVPRGGVSASDSLPAAESRNIICRFPPTTLPPKPLTA